jgi:transcriptional regulator with XRE-family HTH domain
MNSFNNQILVDYTGINTKISGYTKMVSLNMLQTMKYIADIRERKASNLARLRKKFNLRQKDIAEMINAKESNVSEMERGKRAISERVINILCRKLKIDPGEFYYILETPFIIDPRELKILKRLRVKPEILNQIDIISEALEARYIKGEKLFHNDTAIQEAKQEKRRKTVKSV